MSTDWTTIGHVELNNSKDLTFRAIEEALLPHQPRRNVVKPILLTSNNAKRTAFVTASGLSSAVTESAHATSSSKGEAANPCTDFVLMGWAEEGEAGIPLQEANLSLLDHPNFSKTPRSTIVLTSDNKNCTHFVTNGTCSTKLTNSDVLWMEKVAGCKPGTLFHRFRKASSEPLSACELPWDPERRYIGLCAAKALRTPRGYKSAEHLEILRRSDPLVNLAAMHDWSELHAQVKRSHAAKVHQQALIDRALKAHALMTGTTVRGPSPVAITPPKKRHSAPTKHLPLHAARHAADTVAPWAMLPPAKNGNALKRAMHLDRLRTVDEPRLAERTSNDSIMAQHLELPPFDPTPHPKVQKALPLDQIYPGTPIKKTLHPDSPLGVGERSPTSVTAAGSELEKDFPPLPAKLGNGKFVESALHGYKVVADGQAWYSDA